MRLNEAQIKHRESTFTDRPDNTKAGFFFSLATGLVYNLLERVSSLYCLSNRVSDNIGTDIENGY